MTPKEIAANAQKLINEVAQMPTIGYSNYKAVEAEYRRVLNDLLVLTRETAKNTDFQHLAAHPGD